jgi:hypothetical protein
MDRRVFMVVGGPALTELVWAAVNTEPARLAAALNGGRVGATLIEQVEETIPRLRQLDDQQGGGGTNLIYVNAQFQALPTFSRGPSMAGRSPGACWSRGPSSGSWPGGWPLMLNGTGWLSVTT